MTMDLNCDLGEGIPGVPDADLLDWVTSANVACGGHAGSRESIRAVVAAAAARGGAVGAHPSYPDRTNFGRIRIEMALDDLRRSVAEQVTEVVTATLDAGQKFHHVKPHGALYHACAEEPVARAVALGVADAVGVVPLVGACGSPALGVWNAMGFPVRAEAFADRAYEPDGSLRARTQPGAVLSSAPDAAAQALDIALGRGVQTSAGRVMLRADTLCIHSDSPGALVAARAVVEALRRAGVEVRASP